MQVSSFADFGSSDVQLYRYYLEVILHSAGGLCVEDRRLFVRASGLGWSCRAGKGVEAVGEGVVDDGARKFVGVGGGAVSDGGCDRVAGDGVDSGVARDGLAEAGRGATRGLGVLPEVSSGVESCGIAQRGKNYLRNKAARDRKKRRLRAWSAGVAGGSSVRVASVAGSRCETVSSVRTPLQVSFDSRREMENRVATRRSELQLARLNDEKAVAAFDDMIHKQRIQRSVRATELAEKSLASTESISPSSSASQFEIRQMFKRCEELEERERHHSKFREDLLRVPGLPDEVKELMLFDSMGASTIDQVAAGWLAEYPEV